MDSSPINFDYLIRKKSIQDIIAGIADIGGPRSTEDSIISDFSNAYKNIEGTRRKIN